VEAVALAILIDAIVGDPARLWASMGHPVTWFGNVISRLDNALNAGEGRRPKGFAALALTIGLFAVPAAILGAILDDLVLGTILEAAVASTLIAHKSLQDHVAAVANADTLDDARAAVGRIVGRDTSQLDGAGVSRASIETLAESLSDGVVAPAFWFAVGGLPGLVAYKVVNTADSMIGHLTPRHAEFGYGAAKVDDVMNFVPARLSTFLIKLVAPRSLRFGDQIRRDADRHVSPNAGWPEATMAYGLNVALGGPRTYAGRLVKGVWLNEKGREATREDMDRALVISARLGAIHFLLYAWIALIFF
jgi:adenosylcobinamide-phosphate synthase